MNKSYVMKLFVTIVLMLTSALWGVESTFNGFVRGGYIVQNQNEIFQNDAMALGGKLGAQAELFRHIELDLGLFVSERMTPTSVTAVNGDFFDANSESFAFLGEASVKGEYQYHNFNFGRQKIDTAHADSDDIRMVMDLYNAYVYRYDGFVNTSLELIHFTQMAGWENGTDPKIFVNMQGVLGITDSNGNLIDKGVTMAHYGFDNGSFSFNAYDYYLYDAFNTVYLEMGFNKEFSPAFSFSFGLQYDANFGDTPYQLNGVAVQSIDAQVAGVQTTFGFGSLGTELSLAADIGVGRDAIMGSWGGGPYFTSIENSTFDSIGDPAAIAYLGTLSQELWGGLSLSYAYGIFHGNDKALNHFSEQNLALSYEKEKHMKFYLAYATITDHVTSVNNFDFLYAIVELPLLY